MAARANAVCTIALPSMSELAGANLVPLRFQSHLVPRKVALPVGFRLDGTVMMVAPSGTIRFQRSWHKDGTNILLIQYDSNSDGASGIGILVLMPCGCEHGCTLRPSGFLINRWRKTTTSVILVPSTALCWRKDGVSAIVSSCAGTGGASMVQLSSLAPYPDPRRTGQC